MEYFFSFIVSLIVTMLLVPPLIKLAPVIGAIDLPDQRKVHKQAIPRIGGLAMIVGATLPIVFLLPFNNQTLSLLLAFLIILVFGIWDDRSNIHYKLKFAGQILAVLIVVLFGDVIVYRVPFIDYDLPGFIAIPFTVFALVGITNAINLSDGLDGLAGGTTLLTFCMIAFLGYKADDIQLVIVCLAVAGAIMGFLRHNTYPARIFMGDTGSQFLGLSAGVLVIILSQHSNTALSPVVPLILLGLPILDTFAVMAQRAYEKRSIFSPDKNHIHHKLLNLGFDHYEAVFIIYLVQTGLVWLAYFMRYEADWFISLIYVVFSATVLLMFHFAMRSGWSMYTKQHIRLVPVDWMVWLLKSELLEKATTLTLKLGIPLFFIYSFAFSGSIQKEEGGLALLLAVFMTFTVLFNEKTIIWEKLVVYLSCVLSVVAIQSSPMVDHNALDLIDVYFLFLAFAFGVRIKISKGQAFQVTPLDFLVVLLVLVVPNLPEFSRNDLYLGESAVKVILLFYASEAALNQIRRRADVLRIGVLIALYLAAYQGLA